MCFQSFIFGFCSEICPETVEKNGNLLAKDLENMDDEAIDAQLAQYHIKWQIVGASVIHSNHKTIKKWLKAIQEIFMEVCFNLYYAEVGSV